MSGMDTSTVEQLAGKLLRGELGVAEFMRHLAPGPTADLDEAQIDLDRRRRCGYPEVVFGQGKTVATLTKIFRTLLDSNSDVLATRVSPEHAAELVLLFPAAHYNALARTLRIATTKTTGQSGKSASLGRVALVTAGTSDMPVAEEARETLLWMGVEVTTICDVGVAGPQRLREHLHQLADVDAVVVVAGMEGALPSVVGGYVACPVIGVPTSVGYGASFGGVAALLSMLNSCAANVTVVNIDAGFKGGYVAGLIAQRARRSQ